MKRFLIESNEVVTRLESRECRFSWFDGRILDSAGFLVNSEVFTFLKTLPDIAESGHAIFIAEGGMGKTFILEEFKNRFSVDEVCKIDLALLSGNPTRLEQDIESGSKKKFLLIDGVDEAVELCPTLLLMLMRADLKAHVIIASRSIPSLKALCENLKWPVFSLLPYTRDDVYELCEVEGRDFSVFMREVEGRGLGGVCAKPLGCKMLLSSFDGSKLVARDSETLWCNALMRLCKENIYSKTRTLMKDSSVPERECWNLSVRIALILKLSGQAIVARISPLVESVEKTVDFSQFISEDCYEKFNECLLRPIFSPIDHDKFRFSHSSYFDFLAAMGIIEYIEVSEWTKIVLSQDGVPFPQWEGVIPWLAARDDVLCERVKKTRPDLLLGSDAVVSKIGVDEICKAILENAESIPTIIRENPAVQARYYALSTAGCVQILADVLKNSLSESVVDTAIDIIRRARLLPMVDMLVDFFCDQLKDISLRESAGYVLIGLATVEQRKRCRVLLFKDMSDRMKGLLLRLLWPDFLSVKELIPMLTPESDNVLDAYDYWLEYEFPGTLEKLSETDKAELLSWAISDIKGSNFEERHFFSAKLRVFLHCWKCSPSRKLFALLAKGLEEYVSIHFSPFVDEPPYSHMKNEYGSKEYMSDVKRRRAMARFIVENEEFSLKPLTSFSLQLLQYSDIDFIIEKIRANEPVGYRRRWVECLRHLSGGLQFPLYSDIWNQLHKEYPDIFDVDVNTVLVERKKREKCYRDVKYRNEQKALRKEQKEAEIHTKNASWVHERLRSSDASERFEQIMWVIRTQTQGGITDFLLDFRKSVLWPSFSEQELATLVEAAYNFILRSNGPWSKGNEYHPAYVQAFYLLVAYDQSRLGVLPSEAWRKFAPELLQALNYDTFDLVPMTLKYFSEHQSCIFFEELVRMFGNQLTEGSSVEVYKFKEIIGSDVITRLLEALDRRDISSEQRSSLYDAFWRIDSRATANHINAGCLSGISLKKCKFPISVYLIASAPENRFSELLAVLHEDPQWGREWVEQVLGKEDYRCCTIRGILRQLSIRELKEIYQWLLENFPPENAPRHTGCYTPDRIDNVYQFISHVFNELVSRSDIELPQMLDALAKSFPRLSYLRDWALRARRILLEKDCPTYDTDSIKQVLLKKKDGIFVNTPNDLLAIVCGTLEKYQIQLTGKENPRIECLWNTGEVVAHKDEAAFSNDLKAYMDLVLPNIVVNREVQLSRGVGHKTGAITDIWVTAISKKDGQRIRLCIEVKGSWNRECKTSFKNQLCEKYLGEGGADVGIFLVGWFYSTQAKNNRNEWVDKCSAKHYLKEQEISLCNLRYNVKSIVIDCTY